MERDEKLYAAAACRPRNGNTWKTGMAANPPRAPLPPPRQLLEALAAVLRRSARQLLKAFADRVGWEDVEIERLMGVLRMILLVANYGLFVFNAFPIIILGVATILGFHLEPDSIIGALMVLLGLVFLGMAYVGHRLINWILRIGFWEAADED